MKSSVASIWLVGMVITFIFVFSAYIMVTTNYSKAFKHKNEVLTIIEKKKGITNDSNEKKVSSVMGKGTVSVPTSSLGVINVFLAGSGYSATGKCPIENTFGVAAGGKEIWYGVSELTYGKKKSHKVEKITNSNRDKKFYYCFSKKGRDASRIGKRMNKCDNKDYIPYYYDVVLFYKLELPLLGDLFTFRVDGTTADIYDVSTFGVANYGCSFV